MRSSELNRRSFLQRLLAVGAVSAGSGTLLAACGGGDSASQGAAADAPTADSAPTGGACSDLTGLTEQEAAMRTQLQYVDETADPAKRCDNCALYVAPIEGSPCGGCQLIKGPIAPEAYCLSWAAKAT